MSDYFISEQAKPEYKLSGSGSPSGADAQQSLVQTFMTHRMSDDNILALKTGRDREFKEVMMAVNKSLAVKPGQALQHAVIYGPRGFGKSFMTRMIQVELNQRKLSLEGLPKETAFILLPEEQQNLNRNPHALLNYLTAKLKDWQTGEDSSWQDAMFQWPDKKRMAALWKEAEKELELQLARCFPDGNGLVIVALENFDILLNSVFKDEAAEQRLRKWLDRRNNRIMLLATATGMVDMDYERPLFKAFQSIRLRPWTQDNCITYFNRRRDLDRKAHLSEEQEAKARAITDFIGGNPRLAQLLYTVLDSHDAMTVAETMNMLADKLSDYYRSRVDDLPPLAQGLLDALIRGGEPASSTELAKRVGASGQNDIARVIDDLKKADLITGKQAPGSRQKLFQVTDRVFVHFYRVRQGNNQTIESPLLTILEFLKTFYSPDEMQTQAKHYLDFGRLNDAKAFTSLINKGVNGEPAFNEYRYYLRSRLEDIELFEKDALPLPFDEIMARLESEPDVLYQDCKINESDTEVQKSACAIIQCAALVWQGLDKEAPQILKIQYGKTTSAKSLFLLLMEMKELSSEESFTEELKQQVESLLGSLDLTEECRVYVQTQQCLIKIAELKEVDGKIDLANKFLDKHDLKENPKLELLINHQLSSVCIKYDMLEQATHFTDNAERLSELLDDEYRHMMANFHKHMIERVALSDSTSYDRFKIAFEYSVQLNYQGVTFNTLIHLRFLFLHLSFFNFQGVIEEELDQLVDFQMDNYPLKLQERALTFKLYTCNFLGGHDQVFKLFRDYLILLKNSFRCSRLMSYLSAAMVFTVEKIPSDIFDLYFYIGNLCTSHTDFNDWKWARMSLVIAVIKSGEWSKIWMLIERHESFVNRLNAREGQISSGVIGSLLSRKSSEVSRSEFYQLLTSTSDLIEKLSDKESGSNMPWLSDFVSSLASGCEDVEILGDIKEYLSGLEHSAAAEQIGLLSQLIEYDTADKPEVTLAQMDPDIATWIRNIRQPDKSSEEQESA